MYRVLITFALTLIQFPIFAQQEVEMADTMRSEGKIYVVVSIMALIFLGIAAYLFMMDRKVSGLEKKISEKEVSN